MSHIYNLDENSQLGLKIELYYPALLNWELFYLLQATHKA